MMRTFLLIGGNLGDRRRIQREALRALERSCGDIFVRSSLYESPPWGFEHERHFLNRVVGIETHHPPRALLEELLAIEKSFGRERKQEERYQGRTLDLDILYYEDKIVREADLKIPHPRIPERRFTLVPLSEIAPDREDPLQERKVRAMLADCEDPIGVKVLEEGCITST